MSHIDPDDLAMVALDSLTLDAEDAQHLRECAQCADELAALELTVGIARRAPGADLASPAPRVWEAIRAEIAQDVPVDAETESPDDGIDPPRSGGAPGGHHVRRGSRLRARLLVIGGGLVAATAALVLVVTLTLPRPVDVATAVLDAFPDHPDARGSAALEREPDGTERVVVDLEADVSAEGHREVWLLTEDGTALVSLGVLDGSSGSFPVPADVDTAQFSVVDISQEPDDGDESHSGDSIVRGQLERS